MAEKSKLYQSLFYGLVLIITIVASSTTHNTGDNIDTNDYFDMNIETEDDEIYISWTLNTSQEIYGFQATIYGDGDDMIYQSPILHKTATNIKFNQELEGGDNKICVEVLANATYVLHERCENVEVSDLKIVIGVLAGTIFLIPCLVALTYILYKDYKVNQDDYKELAALEEDNTEKDATDTTRVKYHLELEVSTSTADKRLTAHLNESFVDETDNKGTAQKTGELSTINRNEIDQSATTVSVAKPTQSTSTSVKQQSQEVLPLDVATTIAMARSKEPMVLEQLGSRL